MSFPEEGDTKEVEGNSEGVENEPENVDPDPEEVVEFEYETRRITMRESTSSTHSVTLYKKNETWVPLPESNHSVSVSDENMSELKAILTNESRGATWDQYENSIYHAKLLYSNDNLTREEKEERI